MDKATTELISNYMCTYYCPCGEVNPSKYPSVNFNSSKYSFSGTYTSFY